MHRYQDGQCEQDGCTPAPKGTRLPAEPVDLDALRAAAMRNRESPRHLWAYAAALRDELEAARQQAADAKEALERYGKHEPGCWSGVMDDPCTCGLIAAQAGTRPEPEDPQP